MMHREKGLEPEELFERLFKIWNPLPNVETVPLRDAVGRVLAGSQYAMYDIPINRAAGLDGIAVRSSDFSEGIPETSAWQRGIDWDYADMGDDFDDAFDAVIPVESAHIADDHIEFQLDGPVLPGAFVNQRGGTVREGRMLVKKRSVLRPVDLALIAMGGHATVPVLVKPRVTFIPTGSELIPIGSVPTRGQCFDSNSIMIEPVLEQMGADVTVHEIVHDTHDDLENAIETSRVTSDIVLVNGGTSKGSEDLNHPILEEKGELLCHWMAAGPGRPLCVSVVEDKLIVIIPGPPMGAFNVMEYFVRTVIDHWYRIERSLPTVTAELTEDIKAPGHMLFLERVDVLRGEDGRLKAVPTPFKGDTVSSMGSSGYFHSPIGCAQHPAGTPIEVKMLSGMRNWRGNRLV